MTDTLSARASRLADLVRAWPRARVPLLDLWQLLDQADPTSRMDARRRATLATLLTELAEAEVICLPSARSFDRTERPPLPRFVTVPRPDHESATPPDVLWHPALSWVPDTHPTPSQLNTLVAINTWLFHRRDDLNVPVRERSLEIFGDEKALDRLLLTTLFGPDRLSLPLLRARRATPRMFTQTVGDGDKLLVVENSDTFDSLSRVLGGLPGPIGIVGWGAGAAFEASVLSIASLDRQISAIHYFGDLDQSGLRIPANASAVAVAAGLPAVRPATGLYEALLAVGRPQSGQSRVSPLDAGRLAEWLAPVHRDPAARLLCDGQRLAQEAIGLAYLLRHGHWHDRWHRD